MARRKTTADSMMIRNSEVDAADLAGKLRNEVTKVDDVGLTFIVGGRATGKLLNSRGTVVAQSTVLCRVN